MKRVFSVIIIMILMLQGFVYAKSKKTQMPSIKFSGSTYTLLYSAKSSETGGYLNEYYKPHQTYASWTDLIGVHHYPRSFYPIEHAKEFRDYLGKMGVSGSLEIDNDDDRALLYFVIIDNKKLPIIMEFNIFKYEKSPVCGTVGIQYAKRYRLNSPLEIEKTKKEFVKSGLKYIKAIYKTKIPEIVNVDADKGAYILKEASIDDMENLD